MSENPSSLESFLPVADSSSQRASSKPQMTRIMRLAAAAVLPAQLVLLMISAWLNRDKLHTDAVAYIRIAQYYLNLQTDLMVSGYWGPMLSWLIVPWLWVFDDPLYAARAAMAVSAVVFLFGGFCVLRAVRLPGAAITIGTWILAFLGVAWSVNVIAPDLLMAGLLCLGTSRLLSDQWTANAGTAFGAGIVLGVAYLAKAVALPVSALMIIGLAGTNVAVYRISLQQAIRVTAITGAGFLIVAGPWIGILSHKYGYPVFSSSSPINHALVGPPDMDRYHPILRIFHKPETGRVTSWEDPTVMPYKYWSPFENVSYAVHQARVIYHSADAIVRYLKVCDWLGLGLLSVMFGYLFATPWRQSLQEERWRWLLIPVGSLSVIYLPVYASEARYYWAAFPFLVAASFGFALSLSGSLFKHHAVQRALALFLVTLSFVVGNEALVRKAFDPSASANRKYYLAAKVLADKLRVAGLVGPVASVGPRHLVGLYLAYLLNTPWFGHMEEVNDPKEILASDAALVVLPRGTPTAKQLREDARFTSADKPLFGCKAATGALPFEVYLTRSRTANDTCPESALGH
jgi:hypothetical protein